MGIKCVKCGNIVNWYEPHKLIDNDMYCGACLDDMNENKSFITKAKKFFSINKPKIILTFLLYGSMLVYNIIFYKPILETNTGFLEIIAQIAYILNFPILSIAQHIKVDNLFLQIMISLIGLLSVLLWNYLISCEVYHLYKNIPGNKKEK